MAMDRRMLVRTGLAVAALLAVSAATAAVAKGGADERRVEATGASALGSAPVGVRVPPVTGDDVVTEGPADAPTVEVPDAAVPVTPATTPRTSATLGSTVPGASASSTSLQPPATPAPPAPPTTSVATTAAAAPASAATADAPVTDPADADTEARPTRCLDLAELTATRHDARTGVVRVEGTVGNCGSLDATFVVRVSDVSAHADPACSAGTRSTPVLVLGPASGDAWSVLTYPAPCPGPYTFRVTAVDADGEQLVLRSISFAG